MIIGLIVGSTFFLKPRPEKKPSDPISDVDVVVVWVVSGISSFFAFLMMIGVFLTMICVLPSSAHSGFEKMDMDQKYYKNYKP